MNNLGLISVSLDAGYRDMVADNEREAEATAWCNTLAADMAVEDAMLVHLGIPR